MGTETTSTETTDDGTTKTTEVTKTSDDKSNATDKDGGKDKGGASSGAPSGEDTKGLKSALAATRKERDDLAKQIRDGELAKLPELERYKTLSEELTKENADLKLDNQRRQVAMELKLPWSIGKRLTGDTLEEMREDGADLAKNYKGSDSSDGETVPKDKKNEVKTTNDQGKAKGGAGKPGMNEALRALAGR